MSFHEILSQIETILSSAADAGHVYDYHRWSTDDAKLFNLFRYKRKAKLELRGWTISRQSTSENRLASERNERKHTFIMRGYMSFSDAYASEKEFQDIIERICTKFRDNPTINDTCETSWPVQVLTVGYVMFGGKLCHYAELSIVAQEYLSW